MAFGPLSCFCHLAQLHVYVNLYQVKKGGLSKSEISCVNAWCCKIFTPGTWDSNSCTIWFMWWLFKLIGIYVLDKTLSSTVRLYHCQVNILTDYKTHQQIPTRLEWKKCTALAELIWQANSVCGRKINKQT